MARFQQDLTPCPRSPTWLRVGARFANWLRTSDKPLHRQRCEAASRALATIRGFEGEAVEARAFGYLRCVHPNAFEELVLHAFEEAGLAVWRNARYTGDGGVDGMVHYPQFGWLPIQSKRFSAHIRAKDVAEFGQLIGNRWRYGLFVHVGRTGKVVWGRAAIDRVQVVSGMRLLRLLKFQEVPTLGT